MAYTKEQIEAIGRALLASTIKDSELPIAKNPDISDGSVFIPAVVNGNNVLISGASFLNRGSYVIPRVTSLEEAVREVPVDARIPGMLLSYFDREVGDWVRYQYSDFNVAYWERLSNWKADSDYGYSINTSGTFDPTIPGKVGELRVVRCKRGNLRFYIYNGKEWEELYRNVRDKADKKDVITSRDVAGYEYSCDVDTECLKESFPYRRGKSIYQVDCNGNEVWLYDITDNFDTHTLAIEEGSNMIITSTHEGEVSDNTNVTVTVTPQEGYELVKIVDSVTGDVYNSPYSFTIKEDRYIYAVVQPVSYVANITADNLRGYSSVVTKFDWIVYKDGKPVRVDKVLVNGVDIVNSKTITSNSSRSVTVELYKDGTKIYKEDFDIEVLREPAPREVVKEVIKEVIKEVPGDCPVPTPTNRYITVIEVSETRGEGYTDVTWSWVTIDTQTSSKVRLPAFIDGEQRPASSYTKRYTTGTTSAIEVRHPDGTKATKTHPVTINATQPAPDPTPVDKGAITAVKPSGAPYSLDGRNVSVDNLCYIDGQRQPNTTVTLNFDPSKEGIANYRILSDVPTGSVTITKVNDYSLRIVYDCTKLLGKPVVIEVVDRLGREVNVTLGEYKPIPVVQPTEPDYWTLQVTTKVGTITAKQEEVRIPKASNTYQIPQTYNGKVIKSATGSPSVVVNGTTSATINSNGTIELVYGDPPKFLAKANTGYTIAESGKRIDIDNICVIGSALPESFTTTILLEEGSEAIAQVLGAVNGVTVNKRNDNSVEVMINCRTIGAFTGKIFELIDALGNKILVFLGIAKQRETVTVSVHANPDDAGSVSIEKV